jgi:hypothetical protein
VEYRVAGNWQAVATDSDWSTRIRWRVEDDAYIAQLSWEVPLDTQAGADRLTHFGYDNSGKAFSGVSDMIHIE